MPFRLKAGLRATRRLPQEEPDHSPRNRSARLRWLVLLLVTLLLLCPAAAQAHKLNVFAHAEGRVLEGNAYFRGGSPAQNVAVVALDPAGKELGRATTDSQGKFRLEARVRCDHRLIVNAGDGHGGEWTVRAAELPGDVPAADGSPRQTPSEPPKADSAASAEKLAAPLGPNDEQLTARVQSLRQQIVELREQLSEHEQRVRFRDILGGIGYIAGLAAAAYYVLHRSRVRT